MKELISKQDIIVASLFGIVFCIGIYIGRQKKQHITLPIENTSQIDSLVNVISVKDGQIMQLEQDYSHLERLKSQTRVKYRDRIIKVRDGDVLVVFEELKGNL